MNATKSDAVFTRLQEVNEVIKDLRPSCGLDDPVATGLNSTWTFTQGWKGNSIKPGAKCVNCLRQVPESNDPDWNRHTWTFADAERPTHARVMCINCHCYRLNHGGANRPPH
jgi:hypothetical protein